MIVSEPRKPIKFDSCVTTKKEDGIIKMLFLTKTYWKEVTSYPDFSFTVLCDECHGAKVCHKCGGIPI